jgi:GT2 family glycosyltransferase
LNLANKKKYAPIIAFVYRRPEHTRQMLNSLSLNPLASSSELFVFSDGPKSDEIAEQVEQVRKLVKGQSGFKSVKLFERSENLGLANNIISGLTQVLEEYGKGIVLEDDIVTSPYFLTFMNEALDHFETEEKVMNVSAYTYPIDKTGIDKPYLLRCISCWGWGTWYRAWRKFEKNEDDLISKFSKKMIYEFNVEGTSEMFEQVLANKAGKMDTWAVFWYATLFLNKGLTLYPSESLANNIGFDGSGSNTGNSKFYDSKIVESCSNFFPEIIEENSFVLEKHKEFFCQARPTITQKIKRELHAKLREIPALKKIYLKIAKVLNIK